MDIEAALLVSDASPIIALLGIDRLDLLPALYPRVLVTATVRTEIRHGLPDFVEVVPDPNDTDEIIVNANVHAGERTAIRLAMVTPACVLLVDDLAGRKEAKARGVAVLGTLGLLRKAKLAGLIASVRPDAEAIIKDGLWVSSAVLAEFLRSCGE